MHPDIGEGAAMRAFGLGDFVLVVRELQIGAAAVDIEMIAEQGAAHGRTLDMPTRTTITPR